MNSYNLGCSERMLTADLHEELHGVVGVVCRAVIVLLQDVQQAELLAVMTFQQLFALLHRHGCVNEAEESLVCFTQLQLLQHAANHVPQVHFLEQNKDLELILTNARVISLYMFIVN